jgi:hypothetical protein
MDNYAEVKAFAREYIAGVKTNERRRKISEAYFRLTGERLRITCETCYIEAIFKILRHMERPPCRYRLKKGAVLQGFGDASKFCTNDNLTDELAEWHLQNTRGAASLFAVMPAPIETESKLVIIPPANTDAPAAPVVANKPKRPSRSKPRKR